MTWNMTRNTEKREKTRNVHYRTRNMARKLRNEENETQCMTWNMARNSRKRGK